MPSLEDLMKELYGIASKWRSLGIQLKMPQSTLMSIDFECSDPVRGLEEMLTWSLEIRELSWKVIVDVLRSPVLGEMRLAMEIEQKYCSGQSGL